MGGRKGMRRMTLPCEAEEENGEDGFKQGSMEVSGNASDSS